MHLIFQSFYIFTADRSLQFNLSKLFSLWFFLSHQLEAKLQIKKKPCDSMNNRISNKISTRIYNNLSFMNYCIKYWLAYHVQSSINWIFTSIITFEVYWTISLHSLLTFIQGFSHDFNNINEIQLSIVWAPSSELNLIELVQFQIFKFWLN